MSGPDPAVAATRSAVRDALVEDRIIVAVSGGADSLALLAAVVFEAASPRNPQRPYVMGVTVDHGLQEESAATAERVIAQMAAIGTDETALIKVQVDVSEGGLEAGARSARYAALAEFAARMEAPLVLLGHTRDDQAETVLMGLTRGSGGRSMAGMRESFSDGEVRFARPFLAITRAQTEAACTAQDLTWWEDPHNRDQRFLRARLRHVVLPLLEAELGPGFADALARTAPALRADMDLLDDIADDWRGLHDLSTESLVALPTAIRTRVLRFAAVEAGARDSELSREHVLAIDSLITDWRGQTQIDLPGSIKVIRRDGHLEFLPQDAN
ncbi:MAG TPA: tRNA lysidine(34) synthetase TilS [Marmoricola sp.]|nr:tRNA lysidine(34) synthetase TilS [Marmoricola sp.]